MYPFVNFEVTAVRSFEITKGANVWLVACMNSKMCREMKITSSSVTTIIAHKRFIVRVVRRHVLLEVAIERSLVSTLVARVRFVPRMGPHMHRQDADAVGFVMTVATDKYFVRFVNLPVR